MADAQDSKSCDGNIMSVRPRPPAPLKIFYFIQSKQFIKTWAHPQKVFYFFIYIQIRINIFTGSSKKYF